MIQATAEKNVVTFGERKIRVTGPQKENLADTLATMINNRVGSVFCPECGSPCVHWRRGVYFENEKRCGSCDHCWEPK